MAAQQIHFVLEILNPLIPMDSEAELVAEWLKWSLLLSANIQSCLQQLNQLNNTACCNCCVHKPVRACRALQETSIKKNNNLFLSL